MQAKLKSMISVFMAVVMLAVAAHPAHRAYATLPSADSERYTSEPAEDLYYSDSAEYSNYSENSNDDFFYWFDWDYLYESFRREPLNDWDDSYDLYNWDIWPDDFNWEHAPSTDHWDGSSMFGGGYIGFEPMAAPAIPITYYVILQILATMGIHFATNADAQASVQDLMTVDGFRAHMEAISIDITTINTTHDARGRSFFRMPNHVGFLTNMSVREYFHNFNRRR